MDRQLRCKIPFEFGSSPMSSSPSSPNGRFSLFTSIFFSLFVKQVPCFGNSRTSLGWGVGSRKVWVIAVFSEPSKELICSQVPALDTVGPKCVNYHIIANRIIIYRTTFYLYADHLPITVSFPIPPNKCVTL